GPLPGPPLFGRPRTRFSLSPQIGGSESKLDCLLEVECRSLLLQLAVDVLAKDGSGSIGSPLANRGFERLRHVADLPAPFRGCPQQTGCSSGIASRNPNRCEPVDRDVRG